MNALFDFREYTRFEKERQGPSVLVRLAAIFALVIALTATCLLCLGVVEFITSYINIYEVSGRTEQLLSVADASTTFTGILEFVATIAALLLFADDFWRASKNDKPYFRSVNMMVVFELGIVGLATLLEIIQRLIIYHVISYPYPELGTDLWSVGALLLFGGGAFLASVLIKKEKNVGLLIGAIVCSVTLAFDVFQVVDDIRSVIAASSAPELAGSIIWTTQETAVGLCLGLASAIDVIGYVKGLRLPKEEVEAPVNGK